MINIFRCPSCAAVRHIHLKPDLILMCGDWDMTKYHLWGYPVTFTNYVADIESLEDLHAKLNEMGILNEIDFDHLQCPKCDAVHPFSEWNACSIHPDNYFESDQLCHCGAELWWDKILGTQQYALACEKCGWIKPKQRISGHESNNNVIMT